MPQVVDRFRNTLAPEVFSRASDVERRGTQRASDESRRELLWAARHAQREVIAFLDKIDPSILEGHVDDDFRIALAVLRNQMARRCPATQVGAVMRKVPRGQLPSADSSTSVVFQIVQDGLALEIHRARFSEAQRTAVAIEETDSKPLLDVHYVPADHRRGQVQSIGSGNEATRLDPHSEHFDAGQRIHAASLRWRSRAPVTFCFADMCSRCRASADSWPRNCRMRSTLGHGVAKSQTHQVPTVAALEQQAEHSRAVRFEHAHGPSASA